MSLSARKALNQAHTSIEAARNARGSKRTILKHYRNVKKALGEIDAKETDVTTLGEMMAAFQELAAVLDLSRERERSAKCRQRADALSAALASPLFFSKNVDPVPYTCPLPRPNEPLESTRQLAYCLELLQDSVQADVLPPETLKWRQNTLNNLDEKERLETISVRIVREFAENVMKDAAAVNEVVQLAPVLNEYHSRFLLKTFIDALKQSEILDFHAVEGLATIQGAAPASINSDDLEKILQSLHSKLQSTHIGSQRNRYRLLLAVSQILDTMGDAHIGNIDRVNLYEPLTDLLRDSKSDDNPYLTFQASYATQALLNVSDTDNIWHAGCRRLWLVLKFGAGFAKMPDPREIKDAFENLEELYDAVKGAVRVVANAGEAIKDGETPTFSVKEGLKFKKIWYRTLHKAEPYIKTGRLAQFKDLVTAASCRDQMLFQWGVCQLLGQFAADAQWDLEARQGAIAFLGAIYRDTTVWDRQKWVDQVIFDALTNVISKGDTHFKGMSISSTISIPMFTLCNPTKVPRPYAFVYTTILTAAKSLLEEMKNNNTALEPMADLSSPLWNNIQSPDLTGQITTKDTLIKAVQDRFRRHYLPSQPSPDSLHFALRAYHAPDLYILRVSGEELDLKACFVNLAVVEASANREKENQDLKDQATVFHRASSFERVKNTNTQSLISLEHLFDKRKLRNRKEEDIPKRILVLGRAGIGKTTLCKKLVHAHQNGLWGDLFDAVLWIPFRDLRGSNSRNLEALFRETIFVTQNSDEEQVELAKDLARLAEKGKVLFIFDGLDEIVTDTEDNRGRSFKRFLQSLLSNHNVVITSRPSGLDSKLLPPIDLELETVGFSERDVNEYVVKVFEKEPEAARVLQDFIRRTPLIQGLVNIPVQLDVICLTWDSLPKDSLAITMSGLYQRMVRKLWRKDALRLKTSAGGKYLSERQINRYLEEDIDELMATELQHLGYLAFKGMNNNHQILFDDRQLLRAFRDLNDDVIDNQRLSPPQLVDHMKDTSFLHTSDANPDSNNRGSQQAWHFLHLKFQEYFAATWIVRHFQPKPKHSTARMETMDWMKAFVHRHKYTPQYEIVWWMVAGLLKGESLGVFFELLRGAPHDLIGGRHQQILASCLNEARTGLTRLDSAIVVDLDTELRNWLRFEMKTCQHTDLSRSMLGSQLSFPEASLVDTLCPVYLWIHTLLSTLEARSMLADSAFQYLVSALEDGNERIRNSAAKLLAKHPHLPESVIQPLIIALKDKDKNVRDSAAMALGNQYILREEAIESLVIALKEDVVYIKPSASWSLPSAAWALARQSTIQESAIQSLIAALRDENKSVRSSAAVALGGRSTLPESVIHYIITGLQDGNGIVKSSAVSILHHHPSTLPDSLMLPLISALNDDDHEVRISAVSALGNKSELPDLAIQSLIAVLKNGDPKVKSLAALALGKQSPLEKSAIQCLNDTLLDEEEDVRKSASHALGKQSMLPESSIQSIITALKDGNEEVRFSAARVLSNQAMLPESAIQYLITALRDGDRNERHLAVTAFGGTSTLPESVIPLLITVLKDGDVDVRCSAARALRKRPSLPDSAIESLTFALKDENENEDMRYNSALTLGNQSSLPSSAIQSLFMAMGDEDDNILAAVSEALDKHPMVSESFDQYLVDALDNDNHEVRSTAAWRLGKQSMLPDSVILSLVTALRDPNKWVRASAAKSLGEQSSLPIYAIQSLIALLKEDDED
ncbi:hypothetical protein BGZ83_006021, partial [Gryganskiella cystojenkinii]